MAFFGFPYSVCLLGGGGFHKESGVCEAEILMNCKHSHVIILKQKTVSIFLCHSQSQLNMENLSKPELLKLFSILEGELEARDLVIEALKVHTTLAGDLLFLVWCSSALLWKHQQKSFSFTVDDSFCLLLK